MLQTIYFVWSAKVYILSILNISDQKKFSRQNFFSVGQFFDTNWLLSANGVTRLDKFSPNVFLGKFFDNSKSSPKF
jgi:hypothetical protein